jgi:hypothetical protein
MDSPLPRLCIFLKTGFGIGELVYLQGVTGG